MSKSNNPYHHTCKVCNSPARIGRVMICSKYNCKANKPYKKVLKQLKPVAYPGRDLENYIICPVCGIRAAYDNGWSNGSSISCENNHTWGTKLMIGDKLYRAGFYFEWDEVGGYCMWVQYSHLSKEEIK